MHKNTPLQVKKNQFLWGRGIAFSTNLSPDPVGRGTPPHTPHLISTKPSKSVMRPPVFQPDLRHWTLYVTWKQTGWELNPWPVSRKSNALPQRHRATKFGNNLAICGLWCSANVSKNAAESLVGRTYRVRAEENNSARHDHFWSMLLYLSISFKHYRYAV